MFISKELFHQILAVAPIIFNEISMGIAYGWVAPTLRRLQNSKSGMSLSTEQCSWVASLHEFGRIFGPLLASQFLDTLGRRKILIACTISFFLIWPFVIFAKQVLVIYCVRFVFGVFVGLNDVCSTIYLGENSLPKLRGTFGSISLACFYGGELAEFVLATYLPYETVAIVNAGMTFFALSCIITTTESPQFLITRKKYEEAEKNFRWLRGMREDKAEFEQLLQTVRQESSQKLTVAKLIATPLYYKTVLMILGLCILVMSTGFAAVNSFVSIAFAESSTSTSESKSSDRFTILFGLFQFAACCCSTFGIEKFNRRAIMMTSFLLVSAAHAGTAALYYVHENISPVPYFSWLIFATITLYSVLFSMGIHTIFFTIRGELFPQNVKAAGGSIAIVGHSAVGFASTKAFLMVAEAYGIYVNFLFYSVMGVIAMMYVYFVIPETRGKTLAEIQKAIGSKLHENVGDDSALKSST